MDDERTRPLLTSRSTTILEGTGPGHVALLVPCSGFGGERPEVEAGLVDLEVSVGHPPGDVVCAAGCTAWTSGRGMCVDIAGLRAILMGAILLKDVNVKKTVALGS